jgi:cysteine desulfurase
MDGPVYLDCNATTPIEPRVLDVVLRYMRDEYGNSGSRTHEFGAQAKRAVENARRQVASVVAAQPDEVTFTSGATEANNLAILGLQAAGMKTGRKHVIVSAVEHKAVLEPMQSLGDHGFDVTEVPVGLSGAVDPEDIRRALRPDTLLVSVMQVNNETGIVQPLSSIVEVLRGHEAYLHVDAAQGFGKDVEALRSARIDMIAMSAHKLYAPKGVGALIARRRGYARPPLQPIVLGGGQERGLRPGTLPVPLIAGLGAACELAMSEGRSWRARWEGLRRTIKEGLAPLSPEYFGDQEACIPTTVSVRIPGVDSEAAIVALRQVVALSNGAACTSSSYKESHVLKAMGLASEQIQGALRMSWCHMTEAPDMGAIVKALSSLRAS